MGLKRAVRTGRNAVRQHLGLPLSAAWNRALALTPAAPAFIGAYPGHAAALAAAPRHALRGYDHDAVAEVSFERMAQVHNWDYPVLFWLNRLLRPGLRVLDAGGHMGTKYIAFSRLLPLEGVRWTVQDLPAIVRAARARQAGGHLPAALRFETEAGAAGPADVLLASGLFQYLDVPLAAYLARLPEPPRHAIFNKVATRDGPSVTTLEKIGPARVPYQIRNRAEFEAGIAAAGYRILDRWDIPSLSHVIPTHPRLGASTSLGYCLERVA